ncbi:MAG: protein-methionine-sulfoxide reductase heme-binding subunit MsrQ, partial [Pseudomonadota bacterium]
MNKLLMHPAAKPLVFVLCLLPFAWLVYGAFTDGLGANPAEYLIRSAGDWTLRFICIVLAVTPLRVMTKLNGLARYRRMLGLFAYFYVVVHLLAYSWFDMGFDVPEIAKDIAKRPFILVGFAAFVLLTPLAATSFNRAIKAMGPKRWQLLHKLIYLIAGLGLLHFFWLR